MSAAGVCVVGYIPSRIELVRGPVGTKLPSGHHGNLRWIGAFPMRAGRFPLTHPVAPGEALADGAQLGRSEGLAAFRARGYWASCFPEGDGITFRPLNGQDATTELDDIRACWPGWEILDEGAFRPLLDRWEREQGERDRQRRRAFIEAKERARTGRCSKIIRFGVFCGRPLGHSGRCEVVREDAAPLPRRDVCPRCGEYFLAGAAHVCGEGMLA